MGLKNEKAAGPHGLELRKNQGNLNGIQLLSQRTWVVNQFDQRDSHVHKLESEYLLVSYICDVMSLVESIYHTFIAIYCMLHQYL